MSFFMLEYEEGDICFERITFNVCGYLLAPVVHMGPGCIHDVYL